MKTVQINFDFTRPEIRIPGADFWSCNGLHVLTEPVGIVPNAWFQIHRLEDLQKEKQEHLDWLFSEHSFPILVQPEVEKAYADNPEFNFWALPLVVLDHLWRWPFPVGYSCTFSYQMAMAILLKFNTIDISDVRLSSLREKNLEAPNVLLWAGEAHRRGIEVLLSDEFCYPFKYGQVERLTDIPYWASTEVVNDMFPGWSRETRAFFSEYQKKHSQWEGERNERWQQTRQNIAERNSAVGHG